MNFLGRTDDGFEVFSLSKDIGISENGEIFEIYDSEILDSYSDYIVDILGLKSFNALNAIDYCKSHLICLADMLVDGNHVDIINKLINGESFEILTDDIDDLQDTEPEIIKFNGFKAKLNSDGTIDIMSNIPNKGFSMENIADKMKTFLPDEETTAKLIAICKALLYKVDKYCEFEQLKKN